MPLATDESTAGVFRVQAAMLVGGAIGSPAGAVSRPVEPRIATAMTPGGGVAGVGFDGNGLGDEVATLTSRRRH